MTRVLRCSRGHTWSPDGSPSCPVCGADALVAHGLSTPPQHVLNTLPTDLAPPGDNTTGIFLQPGASLTQSGPSFASLVGMPGEEHYTRPVNSMPSSGTGTPLPKPDVPGYEIVAEIGRGGMGVVYKARQQALNRTVALKMILAGAHAGAAERERFQREAEAAAALQHPHIVQIFEIGEAAGHLYLALEIVEGGNLAEHLAGTPWPATDAAGLIEVLARAMHFAHERGIVHRDLKPGNVLINPEFEPAAAESPHKSHPRRGPSPTFRIPHSPFQPKVADFGLAKRLDESKENPGTRTGAVLGTPSYIAPEQAAGKGRDTGRAADVYALGAILYELLTGRPPFRGETPLDTVLQVIHDDPVPPKQLHPKVPRDLETICLKCLSKSPAKRYPTALALAEDLQRFHAGEPIRARPLSPVGRAVRWARRHPARAALLLVTTIAVVSVVTVLSTAYVKVRNAVADKDAEARIARQARDLARQLADENDLARRGAVRQADLLKQEVDRSKRAAYALQLAQVAALVERDPLRASQILDDEARCPASLRDFTWNFLRRLCRREDRVYTGHGGVPLYAVAVGPSSSLVATAGGDHTVHLWDARTGITLAILRGHTKRVTGVDFRPDGRAVAAVGADGSVRLWQVPTSAFILARGDPWLEFLARRALQPAEEQPDVTLENVHEGGANAVAFSPDGRTLATCGQDGAVRLWELGNWRNDRPDLALAGGAGSWAWTVGHARTNLTARPIWELRSIEGNGPSVHSLAFSPNGRYLATGSADGTVRVWDDDGSALVREIPPQAAEPILALRFTPDGRRLAVTNNANAPHVLLWDTEAWDRPPRRLVGHTRPVYALAASPDGQLLASAGYDSTVRLWDLETGRERGVLQGHTQNVRGAAFSPDRRTLLTASQDGTARVWQVEVRAYDALETQKDGETLTVAEVSSNGETLITGGPDRTVRVWALDADPRGRRVPEAIQVRGVLPAVPLIEYQLPSQATTVCASPDGRVVLAGCAEGVYVWRLPQLRVLNRFQSQAQRTTLAVKEPHRIDTPRPVYGLATNADGTTLAVVCEDGVRLWDLRLMRPRLAKPLVESADVRDVAFGPADLWVAVAAGDSIRMVDATRGTLLTEVAHAHGNAIIEAVAIAPDGRTVATADHTGLIKLWQFAGNRLTEQASLAAHTETVHSLAFSPDGRTLASGGWDRSVVLWDPVTGQERASLPDHADRVLRVQFTAGGGTLMTASRDGLLKRWRAEWRE